MRQILPSTHLLLQPTQSLMNNTSSYQHHGTLPPYTSFYESIPRKSIHRQRSVSIATGVSPSSSCASIARVAVIAAVIADVGAVAVIAAVIVLIVIVVADSVFLESPFRLPRSSSIFPDLRQLSFCFPFVFPSAFPSVIARHSAQGITRPIGAPRAPALPATISAMSIHDDDPKGVSTD